MIDIWYGDRQEFGRLGLAQRWVNILGSVSIPSGNTTHDRLKLYYSLNDGPFEPLSIGPDCHRLAGKGDFNIELYTADLMDGENHLVVRARFPNRGPARDPARKSSRLPDRTEEMKYVHLLVHKNRRWPLPYSARWEEVEKIQDAVQVTDGLWEKRGGMVSIGEPYYDRVLAFGDRTWENYEVTTTVVFHGIRLPTERDGGNSVIHAAMALRWPGHDVDEFQPHRKWYPLGITAEFMLNREGTAGSWRMLGGAGEKHDPGLSRPILLDTPYRMKGRVQDIGHGRTRYSMKLWPDGEPEPAAWDIEHVRPTAIAPNGSALLIAHYTQVSFGDIHAERIS